MLNKLLKPLLIIFVIGLIAILIHELATLPTYKYTIRTFNYTYRTDKITVDGNCISFENHNRESVKVCGQYDIIERK